MIIAREKELKLLRESLESDYSSFIAVYGRRRVGKTFLVREAFDYSFTFQHAGLAGKDKKLELENFCNSIRNAGYEKNFDVPSDWLEAFELLKALINQAKEKKKVLFIDELSWMDTKGSDFMVALEGFWNGWASARKDIVLIVCASATSWMINKIIHNKGGLYNRLNLQIRVNPFTLKECEEYLQANKIAMNRHQILECYMILGGIPYYWSFLRKEYSLSQNIDAMFFADDAQLKDEFQYLYASLFDNASYHIQVVTALGTKKVGMTRAEIVSASKLSNSGVLTNTLEELESSGFVRTYTEFGKKKKDAVYQLIDNYTLFYFKFLKDRPSDEHYWTNLLNMPARNAWCGLAFERVCLEHISQIKQKLGISGVLTETHGWKCSEDIDKGINGSQIDLLILRKDQVINICEMKYSTSEFTITEEYERKLREKISDFLTVTKTKYAIHLTMITVYGLKQNLYSGGVHSVITVDDLFT